ncbi:hypothetical protein DITRI_Ditri20bG0092200 [Diplodiscus trichospermus]
MLDRVIVSDIVAYDTLVDGLCNSQHGMKPIAYYDIIADNMLSAREGFELVIVRQSAQLLHCSDGGRLTDSRLKQHAICWKDGLDFLYEGIAGSKSPKI